MLILGECLCVGVGKGFAFWLRGCGICTRGLSSPTHSPQVTGWLTVSVVGRTRSPESMAQSKWRN